MGIPQCRRLPVIEINPQIKVLKPASQQQKTHCLVHIGWNITPKKVSMQPLQQRNMMEHISQLPNKTNLVPNVTPGKLDLMNAWGPEALSQEDLSHKRHLGRGYPIDLTTICKCNRKANDWCKMSFRKHPATFSTPRLAPLRRCLRKSIQWKKQIYIDHLASWYWVVRNRSWHWYSPWCSEALGPNLKYQTPPWPTQWTQWVWQQKSKYLRAEPQASPKDGPKFRADFCSSLIWIVFRHLQTQCCLIQQANSNPAKKSEQLPCLISQEELEEGESESESTKIAPSSSSSSYLQDAITWTWLQMFWQEAPSRQNNACFKNVTGLHFRPWGKPWSKSMCKLKLHLVTH